MRGSSLNLRLIMLTIATVTLVSCSKHPTQVQEKGGGPSSAITKLVASAGERNDPPLHNVQTEVSSSDSLGATGELWTCTTTRHSVGAATSEFPMLNPNAEVIWPGAAWVGLTIASPTPDRIIAKRGAGTVIINNITGAPISSVAVPEVTQASILEGANRIIAAQPSSFPARFWLGVDRVQSSNELALKMSANADFFGMFSSSASFNFEESDRNSRFLVRLNQSFYTLVFQRPSSIDAFWDPEVTADDLAPFVGPNSPPLYCSSVTYGRTFYLLVESTDAADVVEASINASFLGLFGGNGSVKHVSQLSGLRVRAYALGGDADAAMEAVRGGTSSLDAFIAGLKTGNNIGTAVPMSYVVRSVLSDRVVKNGFAYDYQTTRCSLAAGPAMRFVASASLISQSSGQNRFESGFMGIHVPRVDTWKYSTPTGDRVARAVYQGAYGSDSLSRLRPTLTVSAINGRSAVTFGQGRLLLAPRQRYLSYMDFDASPLAGHDITGMFVARFRDLARGGSADSCGVMLRGTSPTPGQALRFGFASREDVFASQNDAPTTGATPLPTQGRFAIYTVTQSASEGTKIFVNGVLVASDPARTGRLAGFPGAMIGLAGTTSRGPIEVAPRNQTLDLAEALLFDRGLSEAGRTQWESRLARTYGLVLLASPASVPSALTGPSDGRAAARRVSRIPAFR